MANHRQQRSASCLPRLTYRQAQIAYLVTRGLKNREIATLLAVSEEAVKGQVRSILNKTGSRSKLELAVLATKDTIIAA